MPDNKTGITVNGKMVFCEYIGTMTFIADFEDKTINLEDEDFIDCQMCGGNAMKCFCEMYYD